MEVEFAHCVTVFDAVAVFLICYIDTGCFPWNGWVADLSNIHHSCSKGAVFLSD
jgi:hypothetical protein